MSSNDTRAKWFCASDLTSENKVRGAHRRPSLFSTGSAGLIPDIPDMRSVEPYEHPLFPPLFTRQRVSQLASTYRAVASDMGIASLDYWAVASAMDEFIRDGDAIHPSTDSIRTVSDLVLEKLWATVQE